MHMNISVIIVQICIFSLPLVLITEGIRVAAVHLRQIVFDVVFVKVFRDIGKTVFSGIDLIKSGRIDQSVELFRL